MAHFPSSPLARTGASRRTDGPLRRPTRCQPTSLAYPCLPAQGALGRPQLRRAFPGFGGVGEQGALPHAACNGLSSFPGARSFRQRAHMHPLKPTYEPVHFTAARWWSKSSGGRFRGLDIARRFAPSGGRCGRSGLLDCPSTSYRLARLAYGRFLLPWLPRASTTARHTL